MKEFYEGDMEDNFNDECVYEYLNNFYLYRCGWYRNRCHFHVCL